jgi:pimeloyl-ACP methyl ester carboxylesterase
VVALAVALLAASCTTSGDGDLAQATSNERPPTDDGDAIPEEPTPGGLRWTGCLSDEARAADLECAQLTVPVDRSDPDGDTLELELARLPHQGPERIGSLLVNPGGPGGSGIEFLASAVAVMPEELTDAFDIVTWDPRGVGESTPVWCIDDDEKDAQIEGDTSPDTEAEVQRTLDDQARFRQGCEGDDEGLIEHMSTADVAGDLEEIREALGEDQLNYLGYSYGTAIGATYATLFPDRVRAMVLDGAVSTSGDDIGQAVTQAQSFELTFLRFVATCDAAPACALSGRTADTVARARAQLDERPIEVDGRELTRDLFDVGLLAALYDTSLWASVAGAIDQLEQGGAELLLSLADRQLGRDGDGTWDNSWDAQAMVSCADSDYRPTVDEGLADGDRVAAASPTFGEIYRTGPLSCLDWPLAANPVPDWAPAGAPTIMVVGTVGDPATPYEWSREMAAALGDTYLLTYEGDGHTAFLRGGDCIEDAVVGYLVDLGLPQGPLSCPAPSGPEAFEGGLAAQLLEELVDQGLPRNIAECIIESLEEELGASGLEQLLLENDPERITALLTEVTVACVGES